MTFDEIRKDLKEIRYYYSRKGLFENAENTIGGNCILRKIDKYNDVVKQAPPKLYDIYNGLYIQNYTQEALAFEMGYTSVYIQYLNKKLMQFIQEKME